MHSPWNGLGEAGSARPDPALFCLCLLSTVSMKTKDSKRTQKLKPKSEHIRLHYSNCGKNTCLSHAQAVWNNSWLLPSPNNVHTVLRQRELKLLPTVLQLKSLGMWIWAWEVWLAVLLSLQPQLWVKLIHLLCKNKRDYWSHFTTRIENTEVTSFHSGCRIHLGINPM